MRSLVVFGLSSVITLFLLTPTAFAAPTSIVSDTQTEFNDGTTWQSAVPCWVEGTWPGIEGATWIWKSYTIDPATAATGEGPITFRRQFTLEKPASGKLMITADNEYEVKLDGVRLGSDGYYPRVNTYEIEKISSGKHTLSFAVTNAPQDSPLASPYTNPAGLLFRLDFEEKAAVIPTPFLRLPWDYEAEGKSFNDAALAINSFFDHEYPFLSVGKALEPVVSRETVVTFRSPLRLSDVW